MADSIRETILKEFCLRVETAIGILKAHRSRTEMLQQAEMPAAIIQALTETPTQNTSACKIDKKLLVAVLVFVHGEITDEIADPIITEIHKRLMPTVNGFVDMTLGGLPGVQDVREAGINFKPDAVDGIAAMTYEVAFRHSIGDPTVL
jgi:hypothetical protein